MFSFYTFGKQKTKDYLLHRGAIKREHWSGMSWLNHFNQFNTLYFNFARPDPRRKEKTNLNFIFTLFCGASKGFMNVLKTFIKPSEAPQRSVKIKIKVNFDFNITFWNSRGRRSLMLWLRNYKKGKKGL